MCLDELADFEVKQNWGWQCFRGNLEGNEGKLIQRYDHQDERPFTPVKLDQWQSDPNNYHIGANFGDYPTGFHLSLSKKGAKGHRFSDDARKAYFRSIVARGYQILLLGGPKYKTIVARERYVCDKTKRPPKD